MLMLADRLGQLSFCQLMEVYEESNRISAECSGNSSLLQQEQLFYDYLSQVFFPTPGAKYALWQEAGSYVSALRLEPYRDGLLVAGLETAPAFRRRGYARKLLKAVQEHFSSGKLYSHVSKGNAASLALHTALGFRQISNHAVYIDGSVDSRSVTLLWEQRPATSY